MLTTVFQECLIDTSSESLCISFKHQAKVLEGQNQLHRTIDVGGILRRTRKLSLCTALPYTSTSKASDEHEELDRFLFR
jgi:hypothetical protein